MLACLAMPMAEGAQLKQRTAEAFDRYVAASEGRMQQEIREGPFLFIDALPADRRTEAYAQLAERQILVNQANGKEDGRPVKIPDGLIHDWIGVLYIPKASLTQTLEIVQDYSNYQEFYKPEIRRSKILQQEGETFKVFLQLYKKSLVTVVINANFDVSFRRLGTDRVVSDAYSTRLAEVENAGQENEREMPVDDGHGYLWRIINYWRFEERDGGVYVQLESIGLSRGVPAIIGWLVNPLLESIPRGTITSLLGATRRAVVRRRPAAQSSTMP